MARRKTGRDLNGVFLLDKPYGLSSNNAMQRARRLFDANKAGHTGALDPIATGLLPICFGRFTRLSHYVLGQDKRYTATLCLGTTTTTGDTEGEILDECVVALGAAEIENAVAGERGEREQMPPMYSALKHQGKPLYTYARKGIEVERTPRKVTAYRIDVLHYEDTTLVLDITCSSGYYVRSLAEAVGEALGVGAHLTALRRTEVGAISVDDAITLDALEAIEPQARDATLIDPKQLINDYPQVSIDASMFAQLKNGIAIPFAAADSDDIALIVEGRFVGFATLTANHLKPKRLMAD